MKTSVELPQGLKKIKGGRFYLRTELKQISIPDTVEEIGPNAFYSCRNLTLERLSEQLQTIGNSAFSGCENLSLTELPPNLRVIGDYAFSNTSVRDSTLPMTVQSIGKGAFGNSKVCRLGNIVPLMLGGCKVSANYTDRQWLTSDMDTLVTAYFTQKHSGFEINFDREITADVNETLYTITEVLKANKGRTPVYKNVADFIIQNAKKLDVEKVNKFYALAKNAKAKKAIEMLTPLLDELSENSGEIEGQTSRDETEASRTEKFCKEHFSRIEATGTFKKYHLTTDDIPPVDYKDGSGQASPFAVQCAIYPYLNVKIKMQAIYAWNVEYECDAETVAASFEKTSFCAAMESIYQVLDERVGITKVPQFLLAYCSYASEKQVEFIISNLSKWRVWSNYNRAGKNTAEIAEKALCMNGGRAAMIFSDSKGMLHITASLFHTDVMILRDSLLDFGLDGNGKKQYDLGNTIIEMTIGSDLKPSLFDINANKVVKSLPKRGADSDKYESCSNDYTVLKKNIRKAVKGRNEELFSAFLSGGFHRSGKDWVASYTRNPLLKRIAQLVVWRQDKTSFILTLDERIVDENGMKFVPSEKGAVIVAHPLEMTKEQRQTWQNYFMVNNLKQPFEQIWEPVHDAAAITKDRYKGMKIPALCLVGKEKHGICFEYRYHGDLTLELADCDMVGGFLDCTPGYQLNPQDMFTITGFSLDKNKVTRKSNHILCLLDKWTVMGRIEKDDVTIVDALPQFTQAQIKSLLDHAIAIKATNCTAALMEYTYNHYENFDPLAEFTLDD